MHHGKLISLLRQILECPTAPFHEYHVAAKIRELLAPLPHVKIDEDAFGNLIVTYRRGRKKPHLAFAAHMDHPGWVRKPGSKAPDDLEFLGGVPKDRLKQCDVRRFGEFGMWDLPAFELRDDLICSRACDDLIGCVEIVALFQELERLEVETTCHGLFTRAEEVGFVGAVQLAKEWPLADSVRFVSLETSAPRGGAEMGSGPVVRVGDRMSVFDDAVTAELLDAAAEKKIPVQRCLLDGGACEATATQLFGIPSAGMSVLLGNYHNCAPDGGIDVEYVSLSDVKAQIRLIVATTIKMAGGGKTKSSKDAMRGRLEKRVRDHRVHDRASQAAWGQFTRS